VGVMFTEFQEQAEWHLRLENSGVRICDLILGPSDFRVRLADRLEEAVGWLWVVQVEHQEPEANPKALWGSAARVRDLVLGGPTGTSSLAASLSLVLELIEGRVDATAANGVCWGAWSVLTTALSHFLELEIELELLGSGSNVDLTEGQLDALWTQMHRASKWLTSCIPPSVAHDPPDDTWNEEEE
jgi:hypothetical protein